MKNQRTAAAARPRLSSPMKLLCAVLAVLLLLGAGYGIFTAIAGPRGFFLRRTAVMESTHYSVNGSMLAYYYYDFYHTLLEEEGEALVEEGLDPTRPLAEQLREDGESWYDYFMTDVVAYVRRILVFAEVAFRAGDSRESAAAATEEQMAALSAAAAADRLSLADYLTARYGQGVRESDVREAVSLSAFAYRHMEALAATTYSEAELEAVYAADPSAFRRLSYIVYAVKADLPVNPTESEMREAFLAAERTARDLAASTSEYAFTVGIAADIRDKNSEIKSYLVDHRVSDAYVYDATPSTADEQSRWLSDARRRPGDTAVFGENGNYRVVYFLGAEDRLSYRRATVRHILISYSDYQMTSDAKKAADNLLKDFQESGGGEQAFAALAKRHSADPATVATGGLCENIGRGELEKGLSDWILKETRAPGDTAVLQSVYGYHVVYFCSASESEVWQEQATLILQDRAYAEYLASAHLRLYDSNLSCLPSIRATLPSA